MLVWNQFSENEKKTGGANAIFLILLNVLSVLYSNSDEITGQSSV